MQGPPQGAGLGANRPLHDGVAPPASAGSCPSASSSPPTLPRQLAKTGGAAPPSLPIAPRRVARAAARCHGGATPRTRAHQNACGCGSLGAGPEGLPWSAPKGTVPPASAPAVLPAPRLPRCAPRRAAPAPAAACASQRRVLGAPGAGASRAPRRAHRTALAPRRPSVWLPAGAWWRRTPGAPGPWPACRRLRLTVPPRLAPSAPAVPSRSRQPAADPH